GATRPEQAGSAFPEEPKRRLPEGGAPSCNKRSPPGHLPAQSQGGAPSASPSLPTWSPENHRPSRPVVFAHKEFLTRPVGENRTDSRVNLARGILGRFTDCHAVVVRPPVRIQDVLPQNRIASVDNLALDHSIFESLAVKGELLLIPSHVECDRVLRGSLDLELLTVLGAPLIDVGFELPDVGAHCANVVGSETPFDRGVDLLAGNLPLVFLRIPDLDGEDRRILDPARHQSRPVATLRAVESEGDRVTRLQRTQVLVQAGIPLAGSDPGVLRRVDLVEELAAGLSDVVADV